MHSSGELDSLAVDKKELLGLTDSDSSANQLNKDTFARDFQEINLILQELNREVCYFYCLIVYLQNF
jgi:hypothetical protein